MLFIKLKRILFSFLILVSIGVSIKAHNIHHAADKELNFTSDPKISCNLDTTKFVRYREKDADGNVIKDVWLYEEYPREPIVKIEAEAHGFGWAHILFYGNIDEKSFGDTVNTTPQKLGIFDTGIGVLLPIGWGLNHKPFHEEHGSFNTDPKEYPWNGSGSIKLVPWYYKVRHIGGFIPAGSWEPSEREHHTTKNASSGGKWTVELQEYEIPSITYNDTEFSVYETLEVTVKKSDLYYVMMLIDGNLADSKYASSGKAVLRKGWNTGDIGVRTVKIIAYFGDEGEHSTTESSPVVVE